MSTPATWRYSRPKESAAFAILAMSSRRPPRPSEWPPRADRTIRAPSEPPPAPCRTHAGLGLGEGPLRACGCTSGFAIGIFPPPSGGLDSVIDTFRLGFGLLILPFADCG